MDSNAARLLWVVGAYLAGTLPSAYLVARARGLDDLIAQADRRSGEADAHILLAKRVGKGWAGVAAAADVLKALLFVAAAREVGKVPPRWLAAAGVALVLGHAWPPYLRRMAGRGISAAAGVYLALLPLQMVGMGALILAGVFLGFSGLATTIGLVLVPVGAAVQGQPAAFVVVSAVIAGLVALRRIEGVAPGPGVPLGRAVVRRLLYDSSGPPPARVAGGR